MKTLNLITGVAGVLALVLALVLFNERSEMNTRIITLEVQVQVALESAQPDLVEVMGRMQVYSNKLWFAAQSGNELLTRFYLHEIEELMEAIAEADVSKNDHDVSALMLQMGLSTVEGLEASGVLWEVSTYEEGYQTLMNACNGCHIVSGYGMLEMTIPSTPMLDGQRYSPVGASR